MREKQSTRDWSGLQILGFLMAMIGLVAGLAGGFLFWVAAVQLLFVPLAMWVAIAGAVLALVGTLVWVLGAMGVNLMPGGLTWRRPFDAAKDQWGPLALILIVIVLIGSIVVPKLTASGKSRIPDARVIEVEALQTAFGALMAEKALQAIDAQSTPNNDWTAYPRVNATPDPLYPRYFPNASSSSSYCWTTLGKVTQAATKDAGNC